MKQIYHSRRDFIKAFSYLIGTGAFVTSVPWLNVLNAQGIPETNNPSDRIRLGIIGPGSRGQYLMEFLINRPDVEFVAVCDDYPPNLEAAISMTGGKAKGFSDYRKLLEMKNLDGVIIATPLNEHAHQTIDCLDAGLHVFCEKSMAMTYQDCYDMMQAYYNSGKVLQIGHQRMFNPRYIKAIEMIREGKLGKVTQIRAYWHRNNDWRREVPSPELERKINWRLYKEYSQGLMAELATHQIQVANWTLGKIPESVRGAGSINFWDDGREVDDNVNAIYTYPGGIHLVYDSLISNKHYGYEEQVQGNKGAMELQSGRMYSETPPPAPGIIQLLHDIEKQIFEAVPIGGPSWVPDDPSTDKGSPIIDQIIKGDGSDVQMEAFLSNIRESKPIYGLAEEGYYSSIAAIMGLKAIENNEIVTFPKEFYLKESDAISYGAIYHREGKS